MAEVTTLVAQMTTILAAFEKLATSSSNADMAAAIGMLPDIEKAMRKIRARWLAAVVANAAQVPLPLKG